ncbi:MAG: HAMP domain-containing sensor histidine kinase [Pseudomonadota bacterium]
MAAGDQKSGILCAFRESLERDGISARAARFKDQDTENSYIQHIVQSTLQYERAIWLAVIVVYISYAILDFLTIDESRNDVLIIRFIVVALILLPVPFTYIDRLKRYFGWFSAVGLFVSSAGIIAMIAVLPGVGAPPYIIGVLVTFIASSCFMRIPFYLAASTYLGASLLYLGLLNIDDKFSSVDVISMHFFTISIAFAAIATNYFQEVRARIIWRRNQQREADAAYIEKLLIEATAADQSKINFLSMMSHELRTPLHQIIGYAEVVQHAGGAANDDSVEHVGQIRSSAKELLSKIQKMLRYADATAGKIEYDLAITSVNELVEASIEQLATKLSQKGIRIDSEGLEKAKLHIDIFHTCYALNNIVDNAIDASAINARIWISGALTATNDYELRVRDEGVGMSREQLDAALQPFTQTEQILSRSREGMGLGLTLAKRIFGDQDAVLSIDSEEGGGTTVTITFRNSQTGRRERAVEGAA